MMSPDKIKEIFARLDHKIPNAAIELDYDESPYMLLVAVLLSARSTDKQVNKATELLFKVARTPQQILDLGYDNLVKYTNTIGLYKNKTNNILKMSKIILEKFHGEVPKTRDELMSLPGIGRKSADVMLNVIHGHGTVPVDTHVFRVSHRLKLSQAKTPEKMSDDLEKLSEYLDPFMMRKVHHLLVLHGRYVCKAIKPRCEECVLYHLCPSRRLVKS
jgi:endonuclease III